MVDIDFCVSVWFIGIAAGLLIGGLIGFSLGILRGKDGE
jgi:hypothetical protein